MTEPSDIQEDQTGSLLPDRKGRAPVSGRLVWSGGWRWGGGGGGGSFISDDQLERKAARPRVVHRRELSPLDEHPASYCFKVHAEIWV